MSKPMTTPNSATENTNTTATSALLSQHLPDMTTSSSSTSRAFFVSGSVSAESKLSPSSPPTTKRRTKNGTISSYFKAVARPTTPTPPTPAAPSTPHSRKPAHSPRGYLREISTNSASRGLATRSPIPPDHSSLALRSPAPGAPRSPVRSLRAKLPIIASPVKDKRCETNPAMLPLPPQPKLRRSANSAMSSFTNDSRLSGLSSLSDSDTDMDHVKAPSTPAKKPPPAWNALRDGSPDPFGSSPIKSPTPEPQRRSFSKDDVIQASDDEGASDSDDFMPLETLIRGSASASAASNKMLPRTAVPAAQQLSPSRSPRIKRPATAAAYLKAKSTASHKAEFNIEALLEHAARDKLANERIKKATEDCAESHRQAEAMDAPATPLHKNGHRASALKDTLHGVIDDNEEAPQIEKVVRAVERTDSSQTSRTWRFFVAANEDHHVEAPAFPTREMRKVLNGVLGGRGTTEHEFDIDVLYTRTYSVPSSMSYPVLEWLLKSVCMSASVVKSTRIFKCFALSSATVEPLSPAVLQNCMRLLGAKEDVFNDTQELQMEEQARGLAYEGRDWTRVMFMLLSLAALVPYLTAESRLAVATLLVKMAADVEMMASTTVQTAYLPSIKAVFEGLDDAQLDTYATSLAATLLANFTHTATHADILRALPISHLHLAALRRRLAIAFLFRDAQRACRATQVSFGLGQALQLLHRPVFAVHRDTDYQQLRSLIALLDIAIDDGCMPPTPDSKYYDALQGRELLREFNADLDAVIAQLEALSRSIHDMNMSSIHPTEAKGQINILIHRLQHAVRYGGAARTSVYDKALASMAPRDTSMRAWAAAVKSGQAREPGQASIAGFVRRPTGLLAKTARGGGGSGGGGAAAGRVAFAQDLTPGEIEQRAAQMASERKAHGDAEAAQAEVPDADVADVRLPAVAGDSMRFTPTPRSSPDFTDSAYLMSEMAEVSSK